MYIDLNIIYFLLAVLGAIVLVYLILSLNNINKFLKNINEIISKNKDSINDVFSKLPDTTSNFKDASENIKDITEVATDVTANFIVAKENITSNIGLISEIVSIIKNTFSK